MRRSGSSCPDPRPGEVAQVAAPSAQDGRASADGRAWTDGGVRTCSVEPCASPPTSLFRWAWPGTACTWPSGCPRWSRSSSESGATARPDVPRGTGWPRGSCAGSPATRSTPGSTTSPASRPTRPRPTSCTSSRTRCSPLPSRSWSGPAGGVGTSWAGSTRASSRSTSAWWRGSCSSAPSCARAKERRSREPSDCVPGR